LKSDNMTRVSLREAYDNKDVVAQIYAIRDTAESAEDASEQAITTANTASDHVDALVPQVEGAVENANSASASAQASAQTVAGYENRLGAVETGLSTAQHDITAVEDNVEDLSGDLNAVTLRVTTAEGQIVTIQGRVTALETADGQNVKLTGDHAIGNYAVLLTGNQNNISGNKGWLGIQTFKAQYPRVRAETTDTPSNFQIEVSDGSSVPVSRILLDKNTQYSGTGNTTHHLIVLGGRHTDGNGNTHDVGLRLSYNELTSKFVLSMNGVTIAEVSG